MKITIELTNNDFASTPDALRILDTMSKLMGFEPPSNMNVDVVVSDTPANDTGKSDNTAKAAEVTNQQPIVSETPSEPDEPDWPDLPVSIPDPKPRAKPPAPKMTPAETKWTIEQLRAKANEVISVNEQNRSKIKALLDTFGVANMSTLKIGDYDAFYNGLDGLVAV